MAFRSLVTRDEQAVEAEAVLAALWLRRAVREPMLIVIDEAHTTCVSRCRTIPPRNGDRARRAARR